ncbi:basal body-orientation factor 1-like isoform X2 [Neoarius graeffei]|uniref:basal body-orientation factor 1-like isoform X2 n=1 Tax=Neoarius graeffei TaxID=443677 RepID=UPI00298C6583|nr:basal body-orientation factor 1-like isoform X2 [Neoarius graeffei]
MPPVLTVSMVTVLNKEEELSCCVASTVYCLNCEALRGMPKKKAKKGGKKGKGKVKKESLSNPGKECDGERAKASAALWEARLEVTETSRVEYREAARRLARANEELTNQQYRAEKDTTDIIAFLKKKELEKDAQIAALEEQLKDEKSKALQDKEFLVAEYTLKINEMEEKFQKRSRDFSMIQGELKTIKEFRKKKAHMEQELIAMKESMYIADREHKESLARMEHKFFLEKVCLEKEAEQRIAQLAEKAHNEAIVQLDNVSHSVFMENVRLNEALGYHLKETEELKRSNKALTEKNASLILDKETNKLMMTDSVAQLAAQRNEISELRAKVATLEQKLALMITACQKEKAVMQERAVVSTQAGQVELEKLQKLLTMREREMSRVKRLARNIVEQRTQLELFFHEALAQVKQEIITSQIQYRQEAMEAYQKRMSEARSRRKEYPHIRTFNKAPHSTNNVYTDLEEAESLQSSKVDISDLTWEQKERVLRLLFAKMNGLKTRRAVQLPTLSPSSERNQNDRKPEAREEAAPMTFITQASNIRIQQDF